MSQQHSSNALQNPLLAEDANSEVQGQPLSVKTFVVGCSSIVSIVFCIALVLAQPHDTASGNFATSLHGQVLNSPSHRPPLFRITASSPFDAGVQHGRLAKERIWGWFNSTEMQQLHKYTIGEGAEAFEKLKRDNTDAFPTYVDEMRGIAEGADVSLDRVWIANLINDLENLMTISHFSVNRTSVQKGCSDEYVVSPKGFSAGFAHGHNDDWSPTAKKFWYFLSVSAVPGAHDVLDCAGVAYPASLVGWAPTWNRHGMYLTQNTLLPSKSRAGGLAAAFVQRRALCPSRSMDEAISALTVPGWSDGASVNLVDLRGGRMANVELWEDLHSVAEVTASLGNYSHFNEYKHLFRHYGSKPIDEPKRFVRDLRQSHVDSLPAPASEQDIMERLSDKIVFNAAGTLVTLVLNGTTQTLSVWCCGVSAASAPDSPVYRWDLSTFF